MDWFGEKNRCIMLKIFLQMFFGASGSLPIRRGEAEVSEKDIQVFAEQCASEICRYSCKSFICQICNQCMNKETKEIAKQAYLEFMNRGKYRRIFPTPTIELKTPYHNAGNVELSSMNAFMDLWFKGKCHQDPSWCY